MVPSNAESQSVVVIGAGIGGLTTAALLAQQGYQVKVYEQAAMVGVVHPPFGDGVLFSMWGPPRWRA
ncbi:NAD(P)-binding protein [Synechocystis sp. B12]|nr:NAD(P)-binding protein [Synechocystis sp. B12]